MLENQSDTGATALQNPTYYNFPTISVRAPIRIENYDIAVIVKPVK